MSTTVCIWMHQRPAEEVILVDLVTLTEKLNDGIIFEKPQEDYDDE
jgi:hypothetical protein